MTRALVFFRNDQKWPSWIVWACSEDDFNARIKHVEWVIVEPYVLVENRTTLVLKNHDFSHPSRNWAMILYVAFILEKLNIVQTNILFTSPHSNEQYKSRRCSVMQTFVSMERGNLKYQVFFQQYPIKRVGDLTYIHRY